MLCLVVDRVATVGIVNIQVIISVGIIFGRRIVCLIDTAISVEVECMYHAGDRHVFLLQCVSKNGLQTIHHACSVRSPTEFNIIVRFISILFLLPIFIVLLAFLTVHLCFHSKLARLDFFIRHAHIPIKAKTVAM